MESTWKNRIVGYGEEQPDQLLANPLNWRTHSKAQQTALKGVLDDVGYVQNIIVNKRTGHLVDGHLRVTLALRHKQPTVPVTYVDLSESEEALILTTLDPIGQMAGTDRANLAALMEQFNSVNTSVQELVSEIAEDANLFHVAAEARGETIPGAEEEDNETVNYVDESKADSGVYGLKNNSVLTVFTATNNWGIPDYLVDGFADVDIADTWAGQPIVDAEKTLFLYGTNAFPPESTGGTLAFYTHDERFEVLWNNPGQVTEKFLAHGWGALVAPDFTIAAELPFPHQLWNYYRSRWVARYWQEAGLKVIPSHVWCMTERMKQFTLHTLPKRVPTYALQVRALEKDSAAQKAAVIDDINEVIDVIAPRKLLVYGGTEHRHWLEPNLPKEQPVIWAKSWTKARDEWRFPERGKKSKPNPKKEK
jgi:hypothetical protein